MSQVLDIVHEYYQAIEVKDFEKVRSLIDDQYTFKGPFMQFNGADECIEQMKECSFEAQHEVVRTITDGKQVVLIFDWTCSKPFQGTFRMCEYLQVENGRILSAELIFDTANFPKLDKNAA